MCAPMQNPHCGCMGICGCSGFLSVEDEIAVLESTRQQMKVQLDMIERRINGLKKTT